MLMCEGVTLTLGTRSFCRGFTQLFAPGQVWGVLGPNGSGKTTLLHSLAGLRSVQEGRVLLNGQPLEALSPRARAQQLGILLQESSTAFPAPVRECAMLGRHPHLQPWQWESPEDWLRVDDALKAVGLDTLADQDQSTLSGGERQRLKLATLMVQQPSIWLLDEPTNHLD
ncbi:MAG TPA: ABC transporter ATP-binding protein, partial [Motiliproteus sp.]